MPVALGQRMREALGEADIDEDRQQRAIHVLIIDAETTRAKSDWSNCMAAHGYRMFDPLNDAPTRAAGPASKSEIQQALTRFVRNVRNGSVGLHGSVCTTSSLRRASGSNQMRPGIGFSMITGPSTRAVSATETSWSLRQLVLRTTR